MDRGSRPSRRRIDAEHMGVAAKFAISQPGNQRYAAVYFSGDREAPSPAAGKAGVVLGGTR